MAKYKTIKDKSRAEYKEKGSSFLAYVYALQSKNEVDEIILSLKKEHPQARHFCYAYRLGVNGEDYRINDDGEPKNSAGMPIYNQLKSFEVTYILAVVVRYFGGTKLGVSGLVNAYKTAAQEALQNAEIIEKIETYTFRIICEYPLVDRVKYLISTTENCSIDKEEYSNKVALQISSPIELYDDLHNKLLNLGIDVLTKQ